MIKDITIANETITPNDREIAALREHFPACFKDDGSFDIERFKEYLGNKINLTHEGYELRFLGKNYARFLASLETTTVVMPDEAHNVLPENVNSDNVYISGDNLDGLKHLLKSYAGKVKCVYIDPPYNTGSDGFVYNDSFDFTAAGLAERLSIDEEQTQRILDLTKRGSASHSAWLMFMYPRLLLARNLLSEDGVIFISIDDNEQGNLKLICDDVFGEENFVSQLVWEKKKKGSYLANGITNIKEYVLVYSKKKSLFNGLVGETNSETETYPCVNASNRRDVRVIPAGIQSKYRKKNFTMKSGEVISDTTMNLVLLSDLIIIDGVLAQELTIEGNWRYGQEAMAEYAKNREIYITQDLYLRRIVNKPRSKGLKDLLLRVGDEAESNGYSYDFDFSNLQSGGWGSNEDADEEQRLLFGEQSLMSYPKPVLLIMKIIATVQKEGMIVCDFFSGSATTAEAVLRSNVAGKKHKFIMVQLPENMDERLEIVTGDDKIQVEKVIKFLNSVNRQHTLDQIGIERIKRAAKKIKDDNPDTTADLGFKHFTLVEPPQDTLDKLEEFDPDENKFVGSDLLSKFGKNAVLATWLVRDGYGLTTPALETDFAGYKAHYIGKHLYLIDKDLSNDAIMAIVERFETDGEFNPENVVMFGYSFTWTERETLQTNLKRFKNTEKNLHVNFDIRY
ncbi:MAG: site-specific DNA-methyltransferase [Turicibacter sp.]|nr:site-specific DNA-methyltransferase [Turicibacter sp.]